MKNITFGEIEKMLFGGAEMQVSEEQLAGMERCYEFLKEFAAEKVIYGINTGFGPMAQWRVDDRYLSDLQYNIIRSHSTGAGEPLGDLYVKGAMIARLTNLLQGRSGVHPSVALLLLTFVGSGKRRPGAAGAHSADAHRRGQGALSRRVARDEGCDARVRP